MSFILKPCFKTKRKYQRQSKNICSYHDEIGPVESEITIESSSTLNDVSEPKNSKESSLESQLNERLEQSAENANSSLSIEFVINNHETTSSDQDNSASDSSKVQQVDSLNTLKNLLSYSVLSSSSDIEVRSQPNKHICSKSSIDNSDNIFKDGEESADSVHDEFGEVFKGSKTSIDLAHTDICLKNGVENKIEHGAMGKLNEISKLVTRQSNSEPGKITKLSEIEPVKETKAEIGNIICENQIRNEGLIEEHIAIIDSPKLSCTDIKHTTPISNVENEQTEILKKSSDVNVIEALSENIIKTVEVISNGGSLLSASEEITGMKKISTVGYTETLSDNEFEETSSSESELSKEIENAVKNSILICRNPFENLVDSTEDNHGKCIKDKIVQKTELEDPVKGLNYLCRSTKGSEGDSEMSSHLLKEATQNSQDLEMQNNSNSNDECCDNCATSVSASQSKDNVCYGSTEKFEGDVRKDLQNSGKLLKKEIEQKEVDDSNSINNASAKTVNLKVATVIINQVVGDLLCEKPQEISKSQFEGANSLDCCGDCVSNIPVLPSTKEIPCRLAAALENDQTQISLNSPEREKNYSKIHINAEQKKTSRNKRSPNVILNSLEQESLTQDIKTNENHESFEGVIGEFEISTDNKKNRNANKTSELSDSEAEPIIPQPKEIIVLEEINIKHNIYSPNIHRNSLNQDSLLSNSNEFSIEEQEPSEYAVGEASSSLSKDFPNIDEDICQKKNDSNDCVGKMLYGENARGAYTDRRNEDRGIKIASNEHDNSATDEKIIPIRFEPHQISDFEDISGNENTQIEQFSSFENQQYVQSISGSTMIKEDDTEYDKLSKYVIDRDDIRVQIRKIITKAVNVLQIAMSKKLSHEYFETKLKPIGRNCININAQHEISKPLCTTSDRTSSISSSLSDSNGLMKDDFFNDTYGHLEYRSPDEEWDFKRNVDELQFAQESARYTFSSSTISQLSNKSSEEIKELENENGFRPQKSVSKSSDNESEVNDLRQYLKSSSVSHCSSQYLNFGVLNRTEKYIKGIQDRINGTNNIESTVITDYVCPASRPSEQGDIENSDSETETNLATETNVAYGDAVIKNSSADELINCRVPPLETSSVGFIIHESTRKNGRSQVTINLNPRRGNLVVKCSGNFEVIPEETIMSNSATSSESVSVIYPSEYSNNNVSHLDCFKKVENVKKANGCKSRSLSDTKRIENLIQRNLNLFKMYKAEALKPMKQSVRVLPFPKARNFQININKRENKKPNSEKLSSQNRKTQNEINRIIDGNDLTILLPEPTSPERHQEVLLNSDQRQQKLLDKFRKLNNILSDEQYSFSPKSTLPRTPPKSRMSSSKDLPSSKNRMDPTTISENLGSKLPVQKIATKRTRDYLYSPTSKSRKLREGGTPYCYLEGSASGSSTIKDQISSKKLNTPEFNQKFDKKFKSYAKKSLKSGELISYQTSTEWLIDAGIVGQVLTVQEADNAFKTFAGSRVTVNKRDYMEFLQKLARTKKLSHRSLYKRLCQA